MLKSLITFDIYLPLRGSVILLSLVFLNACLSVKPSTTKSGKKYFETFYVGEEGTQYFIKPILFKNENPQEDLLVDFTFRYKNEIRDSAIVNFSIQSPKLYKSIDALNISNRTLTADSERVELLFNEKARKGFVSRFTTKMSLAEIRQLFNEGDWDITVRGEQIGNRYHSNKKSQKTINTLRDKVFIVMQD